MQKLSPLKAVKHALKAVVDFRSAGLRIGLPWILVLAVMSILELYIFGDADGKAGAGMYRPTDLVIAAISMLVFSSIAVNWHRYILLDEVTASDKVFRIDRPVWNYAGRTLLIMLIALVPAIVISAVVLSVQPSLAPLLVIPFAVAGVYIMRMSVALPAMALERKDVGITLALQLTQGNNLQFAGLLALNALILLATFLVLGVVYSIVGSISLTAARILAFIMSVPVNLFLSLFSISLLSSLYGSFVEKRTF